MLLIFPNVGDLHPFYSGPSKINLFVNWRPTVVKEIKKKHHELFPDGGNQTF